MAWNKVNGRPWEGWELDILLGGRTQDPPVPYSTLLEKLPADRTWRGAARVVHEYGLTKSENRATARDKYPGRKAEIFALLQTCALDRKFSQDQARKWMKNVKGIELGRTAFSKRIRDLAASAKKEERVVAEAFKVNGKRVGSLKRSIAKRNEYRAGKSNLVPGGNRRGKDTRGKGEGQDQGDPESAQLLLRSAGDAGHGAERHA